MDVGSGSKSEEPFRHAPLYDAKYIIRHADLWVIPPISPAPGASQFPAAFVLPSPLLKLTGCLDLDLDLSELDLDLAWQKRRSTTVEFSTMGLGEDEVAAMDKGTLR